MTSIPEVATAMQGVLNDLARQAGQQSGFVQRQSKLGGAEWAQTLVFGFLANPQATLEELAQTAAAVGVRISPQGLQERFGPAAAECLRQVLVQAVQIGLRAEAQVLLPLWRHFQGVYVQDSSTISLPAALAEVWPGCGGGHSPQDGRAALKVQVQWELQAGQLTALQLQPGRAQDRTAGPQLETLPAGALCLADLGYFSLDRLGTQSARQIYWLTRVQACTHVMDAAGQNWSLPEWLRRQASFPVDQPVRLGVQHQLPCRLLARRVSPAVATARRRRLRAEARRRGQTVSADRLALADWEVLATNVPAEWLSLAQAWELARVRWQIELLFKLWKSHGQVDESRSDKPWRILCEVYAKLLGQLIQHWLLVLTCWVYPDRSLTKAAQTIRKQAFHLASVLGDRPGLHAALALLQRCLACGARLNKRKAAPSTYQRLLACPLAQPLA